MTKKQINLTLLFIGLIPLLYWIYKYINIELWYDEVYSFERFVLVDFNETLFNYPLPNNHIFYNFIMQLLTRITGIREMNEVAQYAFIFRGFQVIVTLFTAFYATLFLKNIFKLDYYYLAIPILFTTLPFMNFSMQLRGYNMSSLFFLMVLYHIWYYIITKKQKNLYFAALASTLLIYTIPSNIYVLASFLVILGMIWLRLKINKNEKSVDYFKSIVFIVFGIIASLILYYPIITEVISNKFATQEPDSIFYSLTLIPRLFIAFSTKRYILLILFLVGIWFTFKNSNQDEKLIFISLLSFLILPFILSFIHQKFPFERVFIAISPVFCIAMSISLIKVLQQVPSKLALSMSAIIISIYSVGMYYVEIRNNNLEIRNEFISTGERTQDIYQNYYLSDSFKPRETAIFLQPIIGNDTVFLYRQIDYPSVYLYLSEAGLPYLYTDSINDIIMSACINGQAFIVTSDITNTLKLLNQNKLSNSVLMNEYPFSSVIKVGK